MKVMSVGGNGPAPAPSPAPHVDRKTDEAGVEARIDSAPPATRSPKLAASTNVQPPPLVRAKVVTKRSSRPARAITHTPLSMVFPEGFRAPDLPDNPHVISGRALLEGKETPHSLAQEVDDELKELDDPIEYDPSSTGSAHPTMKVPDRAEEGAVVLLVGSGFAQEDAVLDALGRHHVHVGSAQLENIVETVATTSPDLIVIAGDAASERTGERILELLRHSPLSSNVPAAVLCSDPSLDDRFDAYRHGATALIRQSASADQTADRIATLAGQIARHEHTIGAGSEAVLSELVGALSAQVRSALTPSGTGAESSVRLLMHTERDVSRLIDGFVMRLTRHVTPMKTVEYELGTDLAEAGVLSAERAAEAASMPDIGGVRLIIADDDPSRADAIAQQLRAHGAVVAITNLDPTAQVFEQLRQTDPVAIVVGSPQAEREARGLLRSARSDARLRWAAARVMDWVELSNMPGGLSRILGLVAAAAEPEERIREHLEEGLSCDMRLESLGPSRLLRTLAALPYSSRVTLYNRRLRVRVDLAEGLVVGAEGETYDGIATQPLEGSAAVAALFVVTSGRIHVERTASPSKVNIMSPVDVTLALADADAAPIVPSSMLAKEVRSSPNRGTLPTLSERPDGAQRDTISSPGSRDDFTMNQPAERRVRRSWLSVIGLSVALGFLATLWAASPGPVSTLQRSAPAADGAVAHASPRGKRASDPSLTARAERGDQEAVAELESRRAERLDVEQHLALARGQMLHKRSSVVALGAEIARQPALGAQRDTWLELRSAAWDPVVYPEALEIIASLPGTAAADLLYDVWVGTSKRSPGTELAERLLYTDRVRRNASPALQVALDLRRAKSCAEIAPLLRRATESADRRSLHLLIRLGDPKRCGKGSYECRCVLGNQDLRRAVTEAKKRPAPSFETP